MNSPPSPVLIVTGPTASGKSALAADAAAAFDGVIINGDSMQVYGELGILSARPSGDETARAPHRLFGVLAATEVCSAGRWLTMAKAEIEAAWDQGRLPIVTGGTGLYLKALTTGLVSIPAIPDAVRREARELLRRLGPEAFREELRKSAPQDAERIPASDTQRLARAFEVVKATGRALSRWRDTPAPPPLPQAKFAAVVLAPPRADLYAAIDSRFDKMMVAGALDEARALLGINKDLPAAKALGAPELLAHLEGSLTLAEAVEKAKRSSRNFAKRQLTWLRHQDMGCRSEIYPAQYSESIRADIFSFIRNCLLTTQS